MEKNTKLYQTKKWKQSWNKHASNQHLSTMLCPVVTKSCWQALFKLNLSYRSRNPHPQSFGQTKFHTWGGRKTSIQCICSTKQNPVENNPTILWKSSVVQKTLAASPITSMKPDDAPMEKMLWISTTGNPTTIINQCESHQLPSYLSMGVSALMAYQYVEGPIGLGF